MLTRPVGWAYDLTSAGNLHHPAGITDRGALYTQTTPYLHLPDEHTAYDASDPNTWKRNT